MIDTNYNIIIREHIMENNKIIIALLVIIIVILAGMILSMTNFMNTDATVEVNNDTTVEETTSDPVVPDTISVELPE